MSTASQSFRRKRWYGGAIALTALAIVSGLTNPSKADYVDYASTALVTEFRDAICGEFELTTPDSTWIEQTTVFLQTTCRGVITGSGAWSNSLLSDWINTATHRQNYLFFSIYRTEVPGEDLKTIAAFGNFLLL